MRGTLAIAAISILCAGGCGRRPADNHYAVSALIVARHAQENFKKANGVYASALPALRDYASPLPPEVAAFLKGFGEPRDLIPAGGPFHGYAFALAATPSEFAITAMPAANPSREMHYFVDESQVVRWHLGAPAGPKDNPVSTP